MMTKAKRDGGKVEISNWNLDTLDRMNAVLKDTLALAIDEALEISLREMAECTISAIDPDKLMIWLPLSQYSGEREGPQYNLSLSALIEDEIRYPLEERESLVQLRDHLRVLADKIDAALT